MSRWFGANSPPAGTALANLALVEQRAHTLDSAATHYETAVKVLRRSPELWRRSKSSWSAMPAF